MIDVDGQTIGYERRGAGEGPLVVINGFAATRADWDPGFIEALAAGHDLILIDNRGVGESAGGSRDFTVEAMAGDVIRLLDALEVGRANVLGWSMGGFVALELARSQPERVGALTLLATTAGGEQFVPPSQQSHDRLRDLSGSPREQATRLISLLFATDRAAEIDAQFGEIVAAARAALDRDVLLRQIEILDQWERAGFGVSLSDIAHPTLVAAGVEDIVFPIENSERLAAAIPSAWLAPFLSAGHGLMADHPQSLAELITAFTRASSV